MLTKQKREFLRTNYEITDIQLDEFINALNESINYHSYDTQVSLQESGWRGSDDELNSIIIETAVDADRLQQWFENYNEWCNAFQYKMQLAHEIKGMRMNSYFTDWLRKNGKQTWNEFKLGLK